MDWIKLARVRFQCQAVWNVVGSGIKKVEFIERLSGCQFIKEECAVKSYLTEVNLGGTRWQGLDFLTSKRNTFACCESWYFIV